MAVRWPAADDISNGGKGGRQKMYFPVLQILFFRDKW